MPLSVLGRRADSLQDAKIASALAQVPWEGGALLYRVPPGRSLTWIGLRRGLCSPETHFHWRYRLVQSIRPGAADSQSADSLAL